MGGMETSRPDGGGWAGHAGRVLDAVAEGVLVLSRAGRLAYVNPAAARMLGYPREELLAHEGSAHDLLHHSRRDGSPYPSRECPTWETLRAGRTVRTPAAEGEVLWRKDGSPLPVSYVCSPIVEEGKVTGAAIVFTDASERLRRQDERAALHREAAQSEKLAAMGTLVSGLSHEVKTPLTILANNAWLARHHLEQRALASAEAREAWEAVRERFEEMEDAVDRMGALVDELRRFSRLDETEPSPASLEHVVSQAARLFRLAFRSSVRVELDLRETLPVLVDVYKVQQMLLNLLENAAQATVGSGGVIRVATRMAEDGASALLVVQDEGPGIPEDVRARMYDPLFTTREEGTGLGLAIVKRVVEEHGAAIACESIPGEGTTFTVAFSLAPPA